VGKTKAMTVSRQPTPIQITTDKKQQVNEEYFNCLGRITNGATRTRETKSRTVMTKAAFNKGKVLFTSKLDLNLRTKLVKCHIYSIVLCGAETWALLRVDQKCPESFEMWCWRRMDKISWTDRVRNEEVLRRVKEERNILHTMKGRKVNWIGHIFGRNCLLEHYIEGKIEERIEVTERRERGRKQLLDGLKEQKGYWKLKGEELDRTLWRTRFGRGYGLATGQNDE
jgi:hypothetical protein